MKEYGTKTWLHLNMQPINPNGVIMVRKWLSLDLLENRDLHFRVLEGSYTNIQRMSFIVYSGDNTYRRRLVLYKRNDTTTEMNIPQNWVIGVILR